MGDHHNDAHVEQDKQDQHQTIIQRKAHPGAEIEAHSQQRTPPRGG